MNSLVTDLIYRVLQQKLLFLPNLQLPPPDYILEVSRQTGIILDPVYTGKAVRGLLQEMSGNPGRFKGRRILYIHTGTLWVW